MIAGTGFYANGTPIPGHERNVAIDKIAKYACGLFGGITIRQHWGGWMNNGKLVDEPGSTFEALVDDLLQGGATEAEQLAAVAEHGNALAIKVRAELQQTCVILTVDRLAFGKIVS